MRKFEMRCKDNIVEVRRKENDYYVVAKHQGNEMTYYLFPVVTVENNKVAFPESSIARRLTGDFVHCVEQLESRMDTIQVKTVHYNEHTVSTHIVFNGIENAICTIVDTNDSTVTIDTQYKGYHFNKTFTLHIDASGSIRI